MIRTLKFALHYQPANSQTIGYYATQQNAAYNAAVDVLNQEPDLPKRSGRHHPDALNKRITAWRQRNRQRADAPYYIHQQGAEEAWEANQRMRQARDDRQQRIAQAIANGEEPKPRDIRPHRRTLAHRTRKKGPLSLTITDRRLFHVSNEGQTLSSRQCGFTVTLRAHQNLKAAKRKLNESLAESAIGYVGKLLREEAAKLGITTVSIPPQSASQTCPRCGDRHPNNRESQAETPFLNVNLAGWATRSHRLHPDLSAATISAQSTNGRPHTGSISQAQPDSRIRIDEPKA